MKFTLSAVTPDQFPRIAEIVNAQVREPVTVDDLVREEEARPKDDPFLRIGAFTEEGLLAGYGLAEGGSGRRPGEFWMRVRVDASFGRHGIGQALYDEVLAFARSHGATRLESVVREDEPDAFAWAERRGFVKEHHLFESTLSLPEFDPTPFQAVIEQVKASGIRFTTLAAETRDGDRLGALRRYYEFSLKLSKDIPGNSDRPDYPWEHYLTWVQTNPKWKDELVLLAADGDRWAGLCQMGPQNSGALYNNFTAVDPEYRGRHLALALKVWSLQIAKEMGAPYIRTNNHSVNQPMLAVNRKLGYQPLPGQYLLAAKI